MILHVVKAKYRGGYKIWLAFNDGTTGIADLSRRLNGPLFGPLRDLKAFGRFRLDPLLDTIVWNDELDLAPEYLRDLVLAGSKSAKRPARGPSLPPTGRRRGSRSSPRPAGIGTRTRG